MPFSPPALVCLIAVVAVLLSLAASASDLHAVMDKNFVVACDGTEAQLQCSPGTFIEVIDAFYGRYTADYCNTGPVLTNACNSGSIAKVLSSARCNNKQACRIPTNIFGDPCHGTFKYLEVTYSCRVIPNVVVCDGSTMNIQCPAGKFIAIRDAFYGRTSDEHCNFGPRLDYSCSLSNAKGLISDMCSNKQTCAQGLLPDPCHGTLKYMTAAYECLDYQTHVACDGSLLSITCPSGTAIRVLSSFYGRTSDELCAFGPRHTYDCSSVAAARKITSLCSNQQQCKIQLSEFGDPCPNTLKYAHVQYKCT